jgi:hypothetical protein
VLARNAAVPPGGSGRRAAPALLATRVIAGLGIDLVDIARVQRLIDAKGEHALRRLFTADEVDYALSRALPAQHSSCPARREGGGVQGARRELVGSQQSDGGRSKSCEATTANALAAWSSRRSGSGAWGDVDLGVTDAQRNDSWRNGCPRDGWALQLRAGERLASVWNLR